MPVAMTIGSAAHRPGDGRSIDAVLDHADQAMYAQRRHQRKLVLHRGNQAIGAVE